MKPETFKIAERIRFDNHSSISAEIAEKIGMCRVKISRREIERRITWVVKHHFYDDDRTFEKCATWSTRRDQWFFFFERRIS